jgi:hypothetical protein
LPLLVRSSGRVQGGVFSAGLGSRAHGSIPGSYLKGS